MVVFLQSVFIRAEFVVIGQTGCILAKVVVFGKKLFSSGKSGYNLAKVFVFVKRGCIRTKVFVFS